MRLRYLAFFAGLSFFSLFAIQTLPAQIPSASDTTSTPAAGAHDYVHSPFETVNPANGSTSIRISVRMPQGRQLTVPFSFAYDSNGAFFIGQPPIGGAPGYQPIPTTVNSQGGWSYTYPVLSFQWGTWQIPGSLDSYITCNGSFGYVFQDPSGNRHNLALSVSPNVASPDGYENCNQGLNGAGEFTVGGEGPLLARTSIPGGNTNSFPDTSVTDGNGTTYSLPGGYASTRVASGVTDRNGNTVTISNSNGAITYTDTIGRPALSSTGLGGNPDTITIGGLSSPYKVYWTTASASFSDNMINECTGGGCQPCPSSFTASSTVVSSIVLPNGRQFTFTYDPNYGMLTKIVYPTGGYVRYVWGLNSQAEAGSWKYSNSSNDYLWTCRYGFPAITDRYESYDGSTEVVHEHFVYGTTWSTSTTWSAKTTTVTTTDLVRNTSFNTVYSYSPLYTPPVPNDPTGSPTFQIPVESSIKYYSTNGGLLKTVKKGWYNSNIRLLGSEQTILDNGQSSLLVNCYNSDEQIIETDKYDLGTGTPGLPTCANGVPSGTTGGALLRKTTTAYAGFTTHIVDQPSAVINYDGLGNRAAETDTYYDQTGSSNRGNPTTITKQCFNISGGQGCSQGNSSTIFTYDSYGQMLTMKDPKGNQTTYSYTDTYSGCGGNAPPTSPSDTYLTQVTYPQTNGVNHIVKYCHDYASGLMLSSTDQNGLITGYKYADSMDRLTETDLPDGGKTTLSYNDTPPTPTVTTTKKINSSGLTESTVVVSNGLGMVKQAQLTSDPQGIVYTDTSYDGLGLIFTVSNPYRSGGDPTTTSGTTTFVYDSLGRKTSTAYPDGSVLTSAYCGPETLVTDPTGKWRRSRTDGLGELVEIDEPNAVGATVNSNGCPGTSEPIWATTYSYDGLGNLISVTQNGSHQRSFTYDSLARLLCSSNPENSYAQCPSAANSYTPGTIGYTYDKNGNLITKTISTDHSLGTAGSGSSTVSGAEQSITGAPAVAGTGSVTFSGTLQSEQVVSQPATPGTGSVTITGQEQSGTFCDDTGKNCHHVYDTGSIGITINARYDSVTYGSSDTASTIASRLTSAINGDTGGYVIASVSGTTISLTSKAAGASTNYAITHTCQTNVPNDFSLASFCVGGASSLTGGHNAVYTTVYDHGTSTITVNGHSNVVSWSGSGTTTSSIASALASNINGDSAAYVNASASGVTLTLTARTAGASTDYSLSSSDTYDSADFSSASFSSSNSGANLTGGRDAGATVYDSGAAWVTINGTQYSASYGQGSSPSSLASALASAIAGGPLANASASGSTITITAKAVGTATNYSLSSDSSTSQPGSFSSPSFSVSVSGPSLMGGSDPGSPLVTSYSYDALNRETLHAYSNGDPSVTTTYDQSNCLGLSGCQDIGHATSTTDAAGSESWAYQVDSTNQRSVHRNSRTLNGITKTTTYYMDLAANVTSITYPTGRVVNYAYSAANRAISAQDSANGITYATALSTPLAGCPTGAVCYTPQGSVYNMSLGVTSSFTGVNISQTFNNRLQPKEIKAASTAGNALDITYNFVDPVSGHNAGHVYGVTNNLNSARSQSFTYDQLNRVLSAGTTATSGSYCWGYQYSYDAWGNLLSQAGWTSNYSACSESTMGAVSADSSNHISGFSFDLSGNTLNDGVYSYTWDAENQMKTAAGVTYSYDAGGRRVAKVGSKLYWYGSGGEILAETNASGTTTAEYIFFDGKRIAMLPAGSNAQYYVEDFLGSSRVVTQNTGTVCYDADFPPYGQERAYTDTCTQNAYKFEGKERDSETQNDEFGARNYSWRFGRWLSADWSSVPVPVPYANLTNPQTLNLYGMVADDPESFADLDGHTPLHCYGCDNPIADWNSGIAALSCDPDSFMHDCGETAAEASAEKTEIDAQNDADRTARQQAQQAQNACQGGNCNVKVISDTGPTGTVNPLTGTVQRDVTYQAVDSSGKPVKGAEISLHETPLPGKEGGDAKNYSYASGKGTSNSEKGSEDYHRAGQFGDQMTTGGKGSAGFRQTYTVEGKPANIIWPQKSGDVVAPSQKVFDTPQKVVIIPEVSQ